MNTYQTREEVEANILMFAVEPGGITVAHSLISEWMDQDPEPFCIKHGLAVTFDATRRSWKFYRPAVIPPAKAKAPADLTGKAILITKGMWHGEKAKVLSGHSETRLYRVKIEGGDDARTTYLFREEFTLAETSR